MKYCFAVLALFFAVFYSCSKPSQATIFGTVSFSYDVPESDSIYIGLYNMGFEPLLGDTLQLAIQKDPHFSFNVKPGKYTLMASTFHSEYFRTPLIIPDNQTQIVIDIVLPPRGIPGNIDSVILNCGQYNWDHDLCPRLTRQGDVWVLADTTLMPVGDHYDFVIDGKSYQDLGNSNINFVQHWAAFNTVHKGGQVIFDPSLYKQPFEKPVASIQGFDKAAEAEQVFTAFNAFRDELYAPLMVRGPRDSAFFETNFRKFSQKFDSLEQASDPYFKQYFLEKRQIVDNYNPVNYKMRKLYTQNADSLKWQEFYNSDQFLDYFSKSLNQLNFLDPHSIIIDGDFVSSAMSLQRLVDRSPSLAEKFQLNENYFHIFLIEFSEKTVNDECGSTILSQLASYYKYSDKIELAREIFLKLKEKFPNSRYVEAGYADTALRGLDVVAGAAAPGFAVKTTTGDSLNLGDLRGKYVFIDFWGTWCGPCRGEIPNIKKLYAELGGDTFTVVGLANDDSTSLVKYIQDENIQYPNALVPDDLLKEWGINAFPTTFLIDPQGQIIAKDLRGEKVVNQIKEMMSAKESGV